MNQLDDEQNALEQRRESIARAVDRIADARLVAEESSCNEEHALAALNAIELEICTTEIAEDIRSH